MDNSFKSSIATTQKILDEKNVTGITSRLESFALASSADITQGSLIVGINPDEENHITLLKDKIVKSNYLRNDDQSVLLAQGLAERLKLNVSDTIVLIGQGYHGSTAAGKYTVNGIVKFGSPALNDKALFMPLTAAQEFYGAEGMITSYVLSLKDIRALQNTGSSVRSVLDDDFEVMTWEELMPEVKQHISVINAF